MTAVVAAAAVEAGVELAVGSEQQQQRFNNLSLYMTISQRVYEPEMVKFN